MKRFAAETQRGGVRGAASVCRKAVLASDFSEGAWILFSDGYRELKKPVLLANLLKFAKMRKNVGKKCLQTGLDSRFLCILNDFLKIGITPAHRHP